ncbi:TIGR03619 family F420-dependent LLM class oxidoreductase [Nocardia farcinica]|uniref:TIGR03619 family F420-dependent LLM class oxidoreductase n=1 Tax=Nocardia farcinica TaxID=37329 RepID=UPI000A39D91A|nr:TIGR03619 family F420-dependent LLM class oxidoreductase [Nocardia farcinica]MBA4857511.1 TIGR03619 family F420-dependent LLM class oxidoreductase [Nocardia farcinica]MBC9816190.1 TIGR03619 family F420-dependent LLM class oxidoreductase [Nocardia farcinica]MBF6072421.1 TIGR03619 family F420-dependent LLM class oxidoreductase [Nocardia farcinica]MBF6262407.1 TIGR03619 family F420-dependent LLM class oxidoreductase [Nocardia farcinica]MBF6280947.1 TIGR03619 family F420-dependent LLM class oxi
MTTIGLTLPQLGPVVSASLIRDFVQQADEMGFDDLWVQDHFLYALHQSGDYGGSAQRQPEIYQSVWAPTELLAAVAGWTDRMRLGTSILVGGNHWPAQLANRLATVDRLSGGRLAVVGLSVGWSEEEHRAVGVDPKTRGKRMDDFVPALRACWGEDPVEHHGPFFDIGPAIMRPKPVTTPRLMSGMYSAPGLARTARDFDLWNPGSIPIDAVVATLARINDQRPAGKPEVGAIYRLAQQSTAGARMTVDEMAERVGECAAAGLDGVVVETNFCSEITSPHAWLDVLGNLKPLIDAVHG